MSPFGVLLFVYLLTARPNVIMNPSGWPCIINLVITNKGGCQSQGF